MPKPKPRSGDDPHVAGFCNPNWSSRPEDHRPQTWHYYPENGPSRCHAWGWDAQADKPPMTAPPKWAKVCGSCKRLMAYDVTHQESTLRSGVPYQSHVESVFAPFVVGEWVLDDLTGAVVKVLGIEYAHGEIGAPGGAGKIKQYCSWGIWVDHKHCAGARHPWELSKCAQPAAPAPELPQEAVDLLQDIVDGYTAETAMRLAKSRYPDIRITSAGWSADRQLHVTLQPSQPINHISVRGVVIAAQEPGDVER